MTEEKKLLLKDLCARLPYGVKFPWRYLDINDEGQDEEVNVIADVKKIGTDGMIECGYKEVKSSDFCYISEIKPYLRPMSSMTEDEKNELHNNSEEKWANALDFSLSPVSAGECSVELESIAEAADIDWLYSHHFDFRELIKKGLALEAPEDMYKTDDYDKEE